MKFAIVLIICLIASGCAFPKTSANTKTLQNNRQDIHVEFVEWLIDSLSEFLSSFDPIDVEDAGFDFLGLYFNVQNVHLEGFSKILNDVILHLDLPSVGFSFSVELPSNAGSVEAWESNLPIVYGKGSVNYSVGNTKVFIRLGYNFDTGFEPTQFESSVENANVAITGIHNDEELSNEINSIINTFLTETVNDPEIHKYVEETIDAFLDDIFGYYKKLSIKN